MRIAITFGSLVLSLLAAHCSPPENPGDGGDVIATDTLASDATDTTPNDASDTSDAISTDAPVDAGPCPSSDQAAFLAGTPCSPSGRVCTYGYTSPVCGGRTLTCNSGTWGEEHTDPMPACFVDGGIDPDAGAYPCGSESCGPTQFCVHPCSGIDLGPDAGSLTPHCGTPAQCPSGAGFANGREWYCTGCV